jgi:hypothetical protein
LNKAGSKNTNAFKIAKTPNVAQNQINIGGIHKKIDNDLNLTKEKYLKSKRKSYLDGSFSKLIIPLDNNCKDLESNLAKNLVAIDMVYNKTPNAYSNLNLHHHKNSNVSDFILNGQT